jgi:hypothetical protein
VKGAMTPNSMSFFFASVGGEHHRAREEFEELSNLTTPGAQLEVRETIGSGRGECDSPPCSS